MIQITTAAQDKIEQVLATEPGKVLRLAIQGGGCAGFGYQFLLEDREQVEDTDLQLEAGEALAVIDPISLPYLQGATLDYESGLMGSRFVFRNPNVKASCGCGHSFSA